MKNATMLYKAPGPYEIHGGHFDHIIVDADEEGAIDAAKEVGWFETTTEAKAAYDATKAPEVKLPPNDLLPPTHAELEQKANDLLPPTHAELEQKANDLLPPTRAELEQKANELGIKFNDKMSNKKLGDLITATLEN